MSAFEITTASNEPLILAAELPAGLQKYALAGASPLTTTGAFGAMLFQHVAGADFDIWYSNYVIKQPARFAASVNIPILELQIPWLNDFEASWEGLPHVPMAEQQFELSYTPYVNTFAQFESAKQYHTFDIHFSKQVLQTYAPYCRKLAAFLDKVERNERANLLDAVQFINLDIVRVIRTILNYDFTVGLVLPYYSALVQELLTLLTMQVAGITDKPAFSPVELNKARQAHDIILSDLEEYPTVEELAKKADTSEVKLQLAFKYLYGSTVAKFSRQARLEQSRILLQQTNYPLRVICLMVGYPDPGNFSVAFKNHFGYWPGKMQQR